MKKKIALLLTLSLSISCFAGFGISASADEEEYEPITIEFWNSWTGSDGDELVSLINRFNEENKWNITVEMDISAEFMEKMTTAAPAGEAADLVLLAPMTMWPLEDYVVPIEDIFTNTELKEEDFVEGTMDWSLIDGTYYGIPFQNSVLYMFWNKDLFEEAGLDPETPPSTYEEFAEMASQITDESKNVYGGGVYIDAYAQIETVMQRFGGMMVTENEDGTWSANFAGNEGYETFFEWEKGMLDAGDMPFESDLASMFKAGQLGMIFDGTWLCAGCDDAGMNFGITAIPDFGEGTDAQIGTMAGFVITTSASEEEKLACERFIQWWFMGNEEGTDPETTGDYTWSTVVGYPSSYYPTINTEGYQSNERLQTMTAQEGVTLEACGAPDAFYGATEIMPVVTTLQESVVYGDDVETDMKEALEIAQEDAEAIIVDYYGEEGLAE